MDHAFNGSELILNPTQPLLKKDAFPTSPRILRDSTPRISLKHASIRSVLPHSKATEPSLTTDRAMGAHSAPTSPPTGRPRPRLRHTDQVWSRYAWTPGDNESPSPKDAARFRTRPRNRTLEDVPWDDSAPMLSRRTRPRVRSMHANDPSFAQDPASWQAAMQELSLICPPPKPYRMPPRSPTNSDSSQVRRYLSPSHATSPGTEVIEGVLPSPIQISNPDIILELMKSSCGRMQGLVQLKTDEMDDWTSSHCLIDQDTGSLVQSATGSATLSKTLLADLRRCRVEPSFTRDGHPGHLNLSSYHADVTLHIRPLTSDAFDQWLAAFLCWQPLRPKGAGNRMTVQVAGTLALERRQGDHRRTSDFALATDPAIVKVGKVMLLYRGNQLGLGSARTRKRSGSAGLDTVRAPWQKVSCILRENGELKLYTESSIAVLSVIRLPHLSRCAVQGLDRSVLNQEHCLVLYPRYATMSAPTPLTHPIYLALESRILYEAWLVLLRAFTTPELYGPPTSGGPETSIWSFWGDSSSTENFLRIERILSVRIVEARLRPSRSRSTPEQHVRRTSAPYDGHMDGYFAEVVIDGEVRARSAIKIHASEPFWREDFDFLDLPGAPPRLAISLRRSMQRSGTLEGMFSLSETEASPVTSSPVELDGGSSLSCGKVEIDLGGLEQGDDRVTWYPLLDRTYETIGEILLRLHAEELPVLVGRHYDSLSHLLHTSSNSLPVQIAEALPSKLHQLSQLLLDIYQASGHAMDWLMALIRDEINAIPQTASVMGPRYVRRTSSTGSPDFPKDQEKMMRDFSNSITVEANLLFRGNTLLTKSLELHMRRLGRVYLEDTLAKNVREIEQRKLECEVDPNRLEEGADVEQNWRNLVAIFRSMWNSIQNSAMHCPRELRVILRHVRTCAEDRWGKFRGTVSYSSVAGFLFLRFFCPAVLNPKLFGLLADHPEPKTQRALTLVAKSLQGLANMSTFGVKEAWMEPMNHFLSSRRQEFKDFIDAVCAVDSDSTSPPPASAISSSYATPLAIVSRLPPAAREGLPALPYLLDAPRSFAKLVNLWLDHNMLDSEESTILNESHLLLSFHQKCLSLRQRTSDLLARSEKAVVPTDLETIPQWETLSRQMEEWAKPKRESLAFPTQFPMSALNSFSRDDAVAELRYPHLHRSFSSESLLGGSSTPRRSSVATTLTMSTTTTITGSMTRPSEEVQTPSTPQKETTFPSNASTPTSSTPVSPRSRKRTQRPLLTRVATSSANSDAPRHQEGRRWHRDRHAHRTAESETEAGEGRGTEREDDDEDEEAERELSKSLSAITTTVPPAGASSITTTTASTTSPASATAAPTSASTKLKFPGFRGPSSFRKKSKGVH
ncbi:MAG: hypothetical protein M1838_001011 [Thelocarpon superellum]|nr:MAG: hypothetical protein M1838_001011 [Thelocarpon superellum]